MTAEDFKKAGEIFQNAIEIEDPKKRKRYLDKACEADQKLRAEVEQLIQAHEQANSFLDAAAIDSGATLDDPPLMDAPGTKIGRYELLQQIGEGGMGLVYVAQQKKPVKRKVALKIIKPGMDSRQVIARFEAERQALAVLDHPNIARVFDAGTTKTGRPYFIMEYVKGMSITRYCDEKKLSIEKRLRLFEEVCEGIHHAHQKGIIHRDLKPSNILVSVHGDRAVPKIIDFGIAKAVTQPLTEKTFLTFQGQLLGTPEYMSPEQVDMATQDIDTRSDIYSLGVVLYELLAGVLPFEREAFASLGFAEVQRTIREQEPASPSTRLTGLGEKAKTIATSRDTHVVALARRLHRELEWIPLKAMRKDRCRRYRSASEMADDIRNYLNGLPLIAGPETPLYRMQKFVHKHAGSVVTAALVAVAIILGLIVSTAMYMRSEKALEREAIARVQAEEAKKVAQRQRELTEESAEDYRRSLYFNRIALADYKYRDGNIGRARELLEVCPDNLRGWEWYRLWRLSNQAQMTLQWHETDVMSVSFSPDGKCIVSAHDDTTIKIWETTNGNELMTLSGHEAAVWSVVYGRDSKRIVSGSFDQTVKVWDATTGTELMTLRGHEGPVRSVTCSPDGKLIASGSYDDTIKVWNAATGEEVTTLRGHEDDVESVAFSPDGKRIVSGSDDKTIKVWDVATGAELVTFRGITEGVCSVSFSPDGKRLISGHQDKTVKIWDATVGIELTTLHGHEGSVRSVAFSSDGKLIASGSYDKTIKVWNAATGAEVMTLQGHDHSVRSVAFSPDSKRIVSGSRDTTIKLWDAVIDYRIKILRGHKKGVNSIVFSQDGKQIISGGSDKTIKIWDAETGTEVMSFSGGRKGGPGAISLSPDGKHLISGEDDKTVKIYDVATGVEVASLSGHKKPVWSVAFSPDGKRIVSGGLDNTIKIWDMTSKEELMTLSGHGDSPLFPDFSAVVQVAFSPDGQRIASGSFDNTVKVWDATNGNEVMSCSHGSVVYSVAFSPDGKRIISGGLDKIIKVWDASTGAELMALRGHEKQIIRMVFHPDGNRFASLDNNNTIIVWDMETGTEVITLRGHNDGSLSSVAISPDGKTIAGGGDGEIILWESAAQTDGYEPRKARIAARKLVDELHGEQGRYSEVIDKLKADETLDESVRKIALQIANSRKIEDEEKKEESTSDDE